MTFLPCSGCHRHVRVGERACPFCGSSISGSVARSLPASRLARGAMFAFASTLAACGSSDDNPGTTIADTGVAATDTGTSVKDSSTTTDTGTATTDTGVTTTDTATGDSNTKPDAASDTNTVKDTGTASEPPADDGGAAPLYGLPPPPS